MKILLSFLLSLISFSSVASGNLESLMERLGEKYRLPGTGIAYLKNGRLSLIETVGIRSIDSRERISSRDRFHLGSQTKAMTAMLVAKLVDQRRISYSSKISEFFPEITFHQDNKNTTIEMLLLHQGGFTGAIPQFESIKDELNRASNIIKARAIAVRQVLSNRPNFIPGTQDVYSNVSYLILGHLLEKVYGKTFEEIIARELFVPLNIKSCGFKGESFDPVGHIISRGTLMPYYGDNLAIWAPAGNIRCNLEDWSKFVQLQLNLMQKKSNFLSASTIDFLFSSSKSGMNYSLGALYRDSRPWFNEDAFTHTGTNLINYSRVWIFPKSNRAILLVTNRGGDESFSGKDSALKEANDVLSTIAEFIYNNE